MPSSEDRCDLHMWNGSQKFNPVLQLFPLYHFLQMEESISVATHYKIDVGECMAYLGDDSHQQINTFAVHQSRNDDHLDSDVCVCT